MWAALVARPGCVLRRLAGGVRARQMQFWRFLRNEAVSVGEIASSAAERTSTLVSGRDILAIQDSSELVFGGKKARDLGFGPIGRGGGLGGLLLHSVLAVDAASGALLGLVGMQIQNRNTGRPVHRTLRPTYAKESQRWLDGMFAAADVLASADRITVIADRESDIYEEYARRPAHVHSITRAAQDRRIVNAQARTLFQLAGILEEQARDTVTIPAIPGRPERTAVLALRYCRVSVRKPAHGADPALPDTVDLTLVDIKEVGKPKDGPAIHWRLLTTHTVETPDDARMIVKFYRARWIVEDYFRTLKTAGFNIEDSEIEDPKAMMRFVAAAACAAVKVLQLVRARDGNTGQTIGDAFDSADQPLLEKLSTSLEGKTQRQKNPHPKGTLAFAAWVIARLGSWDGYYGKPGPKIMRIGLQDFQSIKRGNQLGHKDV